VDEVIAMKTKCSFLAHPVHTYTHTCNNVNW